MYCDDGYDDEFDDEFGEWYEDEDRFFAEDFDDYEPDYAQMEAEYKYYHCTLRGRIELIRNFIMTKLYYFIDSFKKKEKYPDDLPF